MLEITYTVSPELSQSLENIDNLRGHILLTPLQPKYSMMLAWDSMCSRIFHAYSLAGTSITRNEVTQALSGKKTTSIYDEILGYKHVFDYISEEWLANTRFVDDDTLLRVHALFAKENEENVNKHSWEKTREEFKQLSNYWQKGEEHPIIQAGVVYITLLKLAPFKEYNEVAAALLAYLFLYKHGYDIRGFLVLEEVISINIEDYKHTIDQSLSYGNLTLWLAFFAESIVKQLERVYRQIENRDMTATVTDAYWQLNERQKGILAHFIKPDTKITNRMVQKEFDVSQITASRDLSKLASLGLLFSHGKGRSVYYTNIWRQ